MSRRKGRKAEKLDWREEFEFDPDSAQRIADVIELHPMSLQHCAEILELAAPLCTLLTARGFMGKLREIENYYVGE